MADTPHLGISIDRSPQDVFDYVLDIERTPEWRPRMSAASWITEGEPAVGSKIRLSARVLGYTFDLELDVTRWEPPRFFGYASKQGPVLMDSFMEWVPVGDGCHFNIGGNPRSNNIWVKVTEPLLRSTLLKQNMADLERLKEIMESGRDRRPSA